MQKIKVSFLSFISKPMCGITCRP